MTTRFAIAALCAGALTVAGCGSSDDKDSSSSTPAPASTTASTPAAGPVSISMTEFKFDPATVTAKAGKLTIEVKNDGKLPHELVLLKTDAKPGDLKVTNHRVSEKGSVGEIGETAAGDSGSHSFDLKPGHYLMVCNIATHYEQGMYGELTVE